MHGSLAYYLCASELAGVKVVRPDIRAHPPPSTLTPAPPRQGTQVREPCTSVSHAA